MLFIYMPYMGLPLLIVQRSHINNKTIFNIFSFQTFKGFVGLIYIDEFNILCVIGVCLIAFGIFDEKRYFSLRNISGIVAKSSAFISTNFSAFTILRVEVLYF